MKRPQAAKRPVTLETHGVVRTDNYFWLNDRENPEVLAYLKAENEYCQQAMKETEKLQEELFKEMKGRIRKDDSTPPYKLDDYWYYTRYKKGMDYPFYCRKQGSLTNKEEVILDVNILAKTHGYCSVSSVKISFSHRYLAFGIDTVGRRQYRIMFRDLDTGKFLDDELKNTSGAPVWANDDSTVFYVVNDEETLREYKLLRHTLGRSSKEDSVVLYESDTAFNLYIDKTMSKEYIMISADSTTTTEYHYIDADKPLDEPVLIAKRERGHEYHVDHHGTNFYILSNCNAENFKVMKTSVKTPSKENWQEFIAHQRDVLLEDIDIFNDFFVLSERCQAVISLHIISWDGSVDRHLEFDEAAYTVITEGNHTCNSETFRFAYTSLTVPHTLFEEDMRGAKRELIKCYDIEGEFDSNNYISERCFATSDDGIEIPISLVRRKDLSPQSDTPLMLYAYGSYGISSDPCFCSNCLSLLNRGFIYAIAHVRGGEEMGRAWYNAGRLLKKKNTFTDFIACAEKLIAKNYTNSEKLFISGGSAGGLLMGAVVNMRPDLFKAVIANVPFMDVITTMLDEDIPLTTMEYDEWGDPREKEYFDYMLSYSPYDNISATTPPAILVTAGLHDSQVQYWEMAKYIAKLRELTDNRACLLLKTDMNAGHGGKSGRFKALYEIAFEYAFILKQANLLS